MINRFCSVLLVLALSLPTRATAEATPNARLAEESTVRIVGQARAELEHHRDKGSGKLKDTATKILANWDTGRFSLLEADVIELTISTDTETYTCRRHGKLPKGHGCVCAEWSEWDEEVCIKKVDGKCVAWRTVHKKKCVEWHCHQNR